MKKETEGVMIELGKPEPILAEHYAQIANATATSIAEEVVRRFSLSSPARRFDDLIHAAVALTLQDWFLGDWKPGGPTDPPQGAPAQEKKPGDAILAIKHCKACGSTNITRNFTAFTVTCRNCGNVSIPDLTRSKT